MSRGYRVNVLSLTILFLLLGCATGQKQDLGPGADESLQRLVDSSLERTKASGAGSVVWKTAKRSIGASGVLVTEWPDRLRLEVQDPLGGMVAFLVLQGNEFWSYREEEGLAYQGYFSDNGWRRVLPLPLNPEDYLRILLARPPIENAKVEYISAKNRVKLNYSGMKRVDHLAWDARIDEPTLWRMDWGNGAQIDIQYDNYKVISGKNYPMKVRVRYVQSGRERLTLIWRWKDMETYLPKIGDLFAIPPKWGGRVKTQRVK